MADLIQTEGLKKGYDVRREETGREEVEEEKEKGENKTNKLK
jgi:hypothetical protein